ncbi:MAG: twin-arginine translocation signal domain-containing protein [Acidobacteriia bacterium]|nr:twin-arginine translocation signal domain-containing protein [Terriglobia bacterium]
MAKPQKTRVNRRNFLKGASAGTAAVVAGAVGAEAQQPVLEAPRRGATPLMTKEAEGVTPTDVRVLENQRPGSDFMVDVIKSLGFEYVCANPGSSFRSLHESLLNYGGNKNPEFITCCHEESSVAMAHGYYKIEGKPLLVLAHGTVGLQHASMAIYNAWCDRVPIFIILGNTLDLTLRRPGPEWEHSVQDAAAMVRDFVKWDDSPVSLQHFAESAVRAYKTAMTVPREPVVLVADLGLQEAGIKDEKSLHIPKTILPTYPAGDAGSVAEAAKSLVSADFPVIIADRLARTPNGVKLLIELAELLQSPVIDPGIRMNFPSRHPLNQTERRNAVLADADVVLGLELGDFWGTVNSYQDVLVRHSKSITKPTAKMISITAGDLFIHANYQDFQRLPEVDLAIAADAEATLPSLIEACRKLIDSDRKRAFEIRGKKLADARLAALAKAREEATYAWDASPVSTARMAAEIWNVIKNEDWSLLSDTEHFSRWPFRLWDFTKHHQFIGGQGGAGIGYGAPAAAGAALANKKYGRLSVTIQDDGDLMYAPGILWTTAHHKIPLLSVMHNNRAYHQELMHVQRVANEHQRGVANITAGLTINDPPIDYASVAKGMGVFSRGPITNPGDLGPALRAAVDVVKRGEPALIDVVTQPR